MGQCSFQNNRSVPLLENIMFDQVTYQVKWFFLHLLIIVKTMNNGNAVINRQKSHIHSCPLRCNSTNEEKIHPSRKKDLIICTILDLFKILNVVSPWNIYNYFSYLAVWAKRRQKGIWGRGALSQWFNHFNNDRTVIVEQPLYTCINVWWEASS